MPNTDDMKGRAKEAAGDVADDDELKSEGKADQASGTIKEKAGKAKEKFDDAVDSVKDAVTRD